MTRPLHVLYLSRVRLNPYVRLLAEGVHRADLAIHTAIAPTLPWRNLLIQPPDLLHLHWIELQYSYGHPPHARASLALRHLLLKLRLARRRRIRLVYTVHNLNHHDDHYPDLETLANRWLFDHADAIHVHDDASAEAVAAQYGRRERVYIVPHGHYLHTYPNTIDRRTARQRLHLKPDAFIYLCLGQVRPYKGLDQLISAFIERDDATTELVIAGRISSATYAEHLLALANAHPGIRLFPDYIADEDLQLFFNAADACVLPYRRVTTSGAALLAFSFGKPIVAPAIGPFPDLIAGDNGVLFPPDNGSTPAPILAGPPSVAAALQHIRQLDPERARAAALATAASRDWTTLGAQHATLYRTISDPSSPPSVTIPLNQ